MSEATPRPWHYGVTEQGYFGEGLIGSQGQTVFANTGRGMSDASEANAKLIVRAVNNHDALLAACKEMREAAAAMMRVIDSLAAVGMLEAELKAAAIEPGFGVRVQAAIAAAEARE